MSYNKKNPRKVRTDKQRCSQLISISKCTYNDDLKHNVHWARWTRCDWNPSVPSSPSCRHVVPLTAMYRPSPSCTAMVHRVSHIKVPVPNCIFYWKVWLKKSFKYFMSLFNKNPHYAHSAEICSQVNLQCAFFSVVLTPCKSLTLWSVYI